MVRFIVCLILLGTIGQFVRGEAQTTTDFSREAKEILERKVSNKEELKQYLKSLGPEKVYILAIEAAKREPEAAGWILAYGGLSDWKNTPLSFVESYLYFNKFKENIPENFKKWEKEGIDGYIKEPKERGGMALEQELSTIDVGIKFVKNQEYPAENRTIIIQFLWEVWSGFFPRIERMENKSEVYEKMNQQSLSIIGTLNTVRTDAKLSEKADKVLRNFQEHYLKKDLPAEFLQSPSISDVREKIIQSMKKD